MPVGALNQAPERRGVIIILEGDGEDVMPGLRECCESSLVTVTVRGLTRP
jgi:hypothetical protein